ncbi:MAG: hypothetical protein QF408_04960 [Pirellulales bacterium]|jgi:hypothetical protein|nr:hypothetical protein [Pirellulales bacterium]
MAMKMHTSTPGQRDCRPVLPKPRTTLETVRERLSVSVYVSLRSVVSHFQGGKLTLCGILPSFYIKQVMLSLVEDLREEGVCQILDHTEVVAQTESHKGPEWM